MNRTWYIGAGAVAITTLLAACAGPSGAALPVAAPASPPPAAASISGPLPSGTGGGGCRAADPLVSVSSAPHGLFVLAPGPSSPLAGPVTQYLIGNPDVCGAAIFVSWQQVDRGPAANPRYDWSAVQSAIAPMPVSSAVRCRLRRRPRQSG
jgi:hypothetical protein